MLLKNGVTKRKFTISQDNLEYLNKVLSYDITTDLSQYLISKETLSSLECSDLSKRIVFCLNNYNIYEYNRDGKLIPLINPIMDELGPEFIINPISNHKHKFLSLLSNFLKETGEVTVLN